ncbi:hypothetical protein GCM10009850_092890 [Nonomuraea monospora]|uniref:Uncharacterized protein n=1 Tax=Nonomuraea monospora TaxID=568818 RepID=A0ABP5PQ93_9ACTN
MDHATTRPAQALRAPVRLLIATAAAVVANLVIFAAASPVGATWQIEAPYDITPVVVGGASAVPLLVGGVIVPVLARWHAVLRAWIVWGGLGLALVSAVSPFAVSDDLPTSVALAVMHLVVGAAWVIGMRPGSGDR